MSKNMVNNNNRHKNQYYFDGTGCCIVQSKKGNKWGYYPIKERELMGVLLINGGGFLSQKRNDKDGSCHHDFQQAYSFQISTCWIVTLYFNIQLISLGRYYLVFSLIKFRSSNCNLSEFNRIKNRLKMGKNQFSIRFYFLLELLIISRADFLFPKSSLGNDQIALGNEQCTKCLFESLSPMSM